LGATPSLIRLFDASIDLLQEINPVDAHARRLFWVGGWFAPMAIPQDVILDAASCLGSVTTDQAQAIASLERLLDLGLTSIDDQGRPTFHRLVAAYARYRSGEPAAIAVLDALGTAASSNMAQTGDIFQMYLTAHMSSVWMYRQGASPKQHLAEQGKYMQYCAFGKFAAKQRQWDDSIHFYSHALSIAEKTNGHRSSETANLLYAIGQALASKGSHVEALRYLGRNLLIAEKLYGAEHPITATTMKTIGQVLLGQGKQAEAQPYFQHHRAIKEKTLGTPASHERLKPVVSGLSIILGYEHPDIIELESWLK
jgi:tetratricopeptide (TPR) repeat protein